MKPDEKVKATPVFDRADECSGNGYKCNGCGVAWGDHIAPGCQCPGSAQQQTASQEELNLATVDFALKAWAAHESGEIPIEPLTRTLKKKISGALTDCFPVHALSTRVEGHGTAHYRLCVTNGGKNVCLVMSKVDKNFDEITSPFMAMETSMENILPAVRQYRYQASRIENMVNADGVYENNASDADSDHRPEPEDSFSDKSAAIKMRFAELVKASSYYRNKAPGWVALVNGQPWHFWGVHGLRDATKAVDKANRVYETGSDDTFGNSRVVASSDGKFHVQVFDADGDRRPEREDSLTDQPAAIAFADRAVLRKIERQREC